MTLEYKQSLTELNTIINIMGNDYINKLPKKLIKFIKDNMDYSYESHINVNIPIEEQDLKQDTKTLLSLIYRSYWCDQETKNNLLREDALLKKQKEQEIFEKYNPDNVFKNREQITNTNNDAVVENVNSVAMIEYKESIFKKIFNKIKMIFSFKKS